MPIGVNKNNRMKPKLTFLLSLTFLFLFSGFVHGGEPIKTYWKNGNLMNETHYNDEKLEGVETWWWENGKKSSETHWKNDKKEGLDKVWYKNGRKKHIKHYKNDVLHGMVTEWYSSGKKKSSSHYKNGI